MAEERKRNDLEAAVLAFRDAKPEERTAVNAALTQNEAGMLDGLAQEAAEAAVRGEDPERVEEARALAYEPIEERRYFSAPGTALFRSFAGRPDRLKELDVMAYEEYTGPNGFAYREVEDA